MSLEGEGHIGVPRIGGKNEFGFKHVEFGVHPDKMMGR